VHAWGEVIGARSVMTPEIACDVGHKEMLFGILSRLSHKLYY